MNSSALIGLSQDIVHLRTIHNITQHEAATAINVSVGTLSRWESHNFRSTKLADLINLINYLESRGVKFGDTKSISTYKTQAKTREMKNVNNKITARG